MAHIVEVYGETVIGDGWSHIFRDGKLVATLESDEASSGYRKAAEAEGHIWQTLYIEEGTRDWEDAMEWGADLDTSLEPDRIAAQAVDYGLEVTWG